jgi:hypothetical protein
MQNAKQAMTPTIKKLVTVCLALVLLAGVAGCGSSGMGAGNGKEETWA